MNLKLSLDLVDYVVSIISLVLVLVTYLLGNDDDLILIYNFFRTWLSYDYYYCSNQNLEPK